MSRPATITGDQLTNALRALDINFILGGQSKGDVLHKYPARLITALAQSEESRLCLSLIPLFIEHPEFAARVRSISKKLEPSARLMLQCYYTAAIWFAKKYRQTNLPDYFSKERGSALSLLGSLRLTIDIDFVGAFFYFHSFAHLFSPVDKKMPARVLAGKGTVSAGGY